MYLLDRLVSYFLRPVFSFILFAAYFIPCASAQTPQPALIPELSSLQSRADHGDAVAQYKLAQFYLRKDSSSPDYKKVISLARASAVQGNADGEFLLGYLFEHGQGVPKDYAKAAENYRAAALKGHSNAANNLASLYQRGHGVPKNFGLAFDWYLASAQHGNPMGQANLASLYFVSHLVKTYFLNRPRFPSCPGAQGPEGKPAGAPQ